MSRTSRTITLKSFLIAAINSILIGILLMSLGSKTLNHPFKVYLFNAAYSLLIGLGLFANGLVFKLIEKRHISWIEKPIQSIITAIAVHLTYSSILIITTSWIYFSVLMNTPTNLFWDHYKWTLISILIVTIFITAFIYARSFFGAYRNEAIEGERLKQEALSLQYQIMQNQVNPHFLFNSLNILGTLIDLDTKKAKEFTKELASFYRELLTFKDKEIVSVTEEIDFIKKYIYLQSIRFGDNFSVEILLNETIDGYLIPMSLQMLLENAIKHNIISKKNPLNVIIGKQDNNLIFIENNLQPKTNSESSNKIGLKNLQHRYRFLTQQEMTIDHSESYFRVTMPLIKLG